MINKKSAIAANRFGLGARAGDAALIGDEPVAWLRAQLETARRESRALSDPPRSAHTLEHIAELRQARQMALRAHAEREPPTDRAEPEPGVDRDAIREFGRFIAGEYRSRVAERYVRAIRTEQPFVERLVHFWANHFAISADKQPVGAIAVHYENDAIRPHIAGRFVDMLDAVERHPAMLSYLDNQTSIGPNSTVARRVRRNRGRELGLNENLAREILELHTLGVDGGYDQADVTEFAKVLTGWSIGRPQSGSAPARGRAEGKPGEFHFRAPAHEPGDKRILGKRYLEDGIGEGREVLADLARRPATARHVATKLARHFVADDPPARLIDALTNTYLREDGALLPVCDELIAAKASWSEPLAKFKTPHDFVISAFRALGEAPDKPEQIIGLLTQLGQRPMTPRSPAGWPDTAVNWNGGDALFKRIEWAAAVGRRIGDRIDAEALADAVLGQVVDEHTMTAIRRAESGGQALGLLLAAPEFQRR
jgi:uncharacterized protein (DUF1800 family)